MSNSLDCLLNEGGEEKKKTAAIEKNPVGAPGYTAAEIAKFKATMLEWLHRVRLPGRFLFFFTKVLLDDEEFQKQYARAFQQLNDYRAEELVDPPESKSDAQ